MILLILHHRLLRFLCLCFCVRCCLRKLQAIDKFVYGFNNIAQTDIRDDELERHGTARQGMA